MQTVFVQSHGQASVERGFNDDNLVLKLNQNDDTVVIRRFIKDPLGSTTNTFYRSENGLFIQECLEDLQYSLGK